MKSRAIILFITLLVSVSLFADIPSENRASYSLKGPVQEIIETRTSLIDIWSGEPVEGWPVVFQKIEFSENGNVLIQTLYDYSGKISTIEEYAYDAGGRLLKKTSKNANGRTFFWTEYSYDDSGNLILERNQDGYRWEKEPADGGWIIKETIDRNLGSRTVFNSKNRVTEKSISDYSGSRRWVYVYDKEGNLTEGRFFRDQSSEEPVLIWKLLYSGNGRLKEAAEYSGNGVPVSKRTYLYGGENLEVTESIRYSGGGAATSGRREVFDQSENMILNSYSDLLFNFTRTSESGFDNQGRETESVTYNTSGDAVMTVRTEYDEAGNILSRMTSGPAAAVENRTINRYDAGGKLLETAEYTLSGEMRSKTLYAYDKEGNVMRYTVLNPDGSLNNEYVYRFEYDEYGNWIKKETLTSTNALEQYELATEILTRDITYYQD